MIIRVTDAERRLRAALLLPRQTLDRRQLPHVSGRSREVPKPLPACATPVTEGMKIYTRFARAIAAQKATMEFLLINHPLDLHRSAIRAGNASCRISPWALGAIFRATPKGSGW